MAYGGTTPRKDMRGKPRCPGSGKHTGEFPGQATPCDACGRWIKTDNDGLRNIHVARKVSGVGGRTRDRAARRAGRR